MITHGRKMPDKLLGSAGQWVIDRISQIVCLVLSQSNFRIFNVTIIRFIYMNTFKLEI